MATWRDTLFGEGHTRPPLTIKEMLDPTRKAPPSSPLGAILRVMTPSKAAAGTLTGEPAPKLGTFRPLPPEERLRAAFEAPSYTAPDPAATQITTELQLGGNQFGYFVSMQLKRDRKEMTPSGTIILSWPGAEKFNEQNPPVQHVVDGARGEIWLDGQKAATIRIDSRTSHGSATAFRLELSFRGLSSSMVDSSVKKGQQNKSSVLNVVQGLAEGHESKVQATPLPTIASYPAGPAAPATQSAHRLGREYEDLESGGDDDGDDDMPMVERHIPADGETVERSQRRVAREHGYLLEEDEHGNVQMKKIGSDEGTGEDFVLGKNFTEWSVKRDIAPRYSRVTAKGNGIPTDENYGKNCEEVAGVAIDKYMEMRRELVIHINSDHDKESLKRRAVTEANRRMGKGLDVTLTVPTWSDAQGRLWKPGRLHHVKIPVDQVDALLQISNVTFRLDRENRNAQLTLVSPETFSNKKSDRGKAAGQVNIFDQPTVEPESGDGRPLPVITGYPRPSRQ